ncbi:MAG: hypothetical protein K0S43_2613 [Cellulosimicrobium sp.]|nr:hypothetical protein [Cellulosimicrobium sp.]
MVARGRAMVGRGRAMVGRGRAMVARGRAMVPRGRAVVFVPDGAWSGRVGGMGPLVPRGSRQARHDAAPPPTPPYSVSPWSPRPLRTVPAVHEFVRHVPPPLGHRALSPAGRRRVEQAVWARPARLTCPGHLLDRVETPVDGTTTVPCDRRTRGERAALDEHPPSGTTTPLPGQTRALPRRTTGLPRATRALPRRTTGLPRATRALPRQTTGLPRAIRGITRRGN